MRLVDELRDGMWWNGPDVPDDEGVNELMNRAADRIDALEAALVHLVALKDGPRDDEYRAEKDRAWSIARAVVAAADLPVQGEPQS